MGWRKTLLDIAINDYTDFDRKELSEMDVYEFGVFTGDSMKEIASVLCRHKIEVNSFYGFDTFTGMQKETAEPISQPSWDPDIEPDAFNAVKRLELNSVTSVVDKITSEVTQVFEKNNNKTPVTLFPGLAQDSVEKHGSEFKPAFYVDFDMDIYSPTKYVFDYLMKNKLIQKGTFIGYDDWGGTPGYQEMLDGESRAHREIVEQYGIKITKLFEMGNAFPHVQNLWIVEEV